MQWSLTDVSVRGRSALTTGLYSALSFHLKLWRSHSSDCSLDVASIYFWLVSRERLYIMFSVLFDYLVEIIYLIPSWSNNKRTDFG